MTRVKFKAKDIDIAAVCSLAVNASKPVGMGMLHYDPETEWRPDDFLKLIRGEKFWVNIDYLEGRCVKLTLWRSGRGIWAYDDSEPRDKLQTWITEFPTFPDILRTAGVAI